MTISTNTPWAAYAGNGSTTEFAIPFLFFDEHYLTVVRRTVSTGVELVLTLDTDYTVSGIGTTAETFTTTTAYSSSYNIVVYRNNAFLQETNYVDGDSLTAADLETNFDTSMTHLQELEMRVARCLHIPISDPTAAILTEIPSSATRSDALLKFDSTGTPGITSFSEAEFLADVAQVAADAVDTAADVIAAAASAAAAGVSETNAAASDAAAGVSETNAAASAIAAAASAAAAAISETNAGTSETNAGISETNAGTSETNAGTSATNAGTSETNAGTSETNAGTSETNAGVSETNAAASAAAALVSSTSVYTRFNFDTSTTMADPGTGDLRLNNAALASTTAMAISALTADSGNPDVSDFLATWGDVTGTVKGIVTLRHIGTPAFFATYSITAAVTDNTTWLQVTVSHIASSGTLIAADALVIGFSKAGSKGADGAGSGDVTGPASAVDNRIVSYDSTTGKLVKDSGVLATAVVVGPASAVDARIVSFDSTTGKLVKDSGVLVTSVVVGPASVTDGTSALFDGTTGKLVKAGLVPGTAYSKNTGTTADTVPLLDAAARLEPAIRLIPQNSQSTAYTLVLADADKHILHPSADTTARIFTIPANASVAYPVGTAITFVNQASAGVLTIAITTDTMRLSSAGTTGSRTLVANGIATALKLTSTEWIISGTGLT